MSDYKVRIRIGTLDDAPELVRIYEPYVLNHPYTFETEVPTPEQYKERLQKVLKFFPLFVLEREDGHIIGFTYSSFYHTRPAYQWVTETTIYIEEGNHRKGYASMLYKPLLAALKDQGFVEAFALLGCPNAPSAKFHLKQGFEFRYLLPKIGFKNGSWCDVECYGLQLNERTPNPKPPVPFNTLDAYKYLSL